MRRDALSVMTALRGYGGLHFSTAVEVLICDMNDIYPEWDKCEKIACVILSLLFCVLRTAVGLLIGRNEAATAY